LSVLMFLLYAAPGALLPLFPVQLRELGFTPVEIAWAFAAQAVPGLIAPFVAGQVADRWWPAEKCLAVTTFLAGALLWLQAEFANPLAVYASTLCCWLLLTPSITLGTAVSFAHLAFPQREFGGIRLWGTVGWMASGWLLGYWFTNPEWATGLVAWWRPNASVSHLSDAFRLAGTLAFALSGFALTLPATPPQRHAKSWLAPIAAIRLLRGRSFAVYCGCAVAWWVTMAFSSQNVPLLLEYLGIPRPWLSPTLTIQQGTEVLSLALLPLLLGRFGLRGTMLLGLLSWLSGLLVYTEGGPTWLVVLCLGTHGLCICCFPVTGQVFVNGLAQGDLRVSAQGLLAFVNSLGLVMGNLVAGWVRRQVGGEFAPTFGVAAVLAGLLTIVFIVGFREEATGGT
jgi:MFS family permease